MVQEQKVGVSGNRDTNEDLIRKISESKRQAESSSYCNSPKTSVIVQSYNHCDNIEPLTECIRAGQPGEVIVCDDGSVDDSLNRWEASLDRRNEFIIRSNDIHEIRAYDRAISFSRGEFLVLCQDDDIPPPDVDWIAPSVALFDQFPEIAIIGLRTARFGLGLNERDYTFSDKVRIITTAVDGMWFAYVAMVNLGPLFVRRRALDELGGLDTAFSPTGWPGIHFDYDLCLRAWLGGWRVGWLPFDGFLRSVGGSGTKEFGFAVRRQMQAKKNADLILARYGHQFTEVSESVRKANDALRERLRSER